MEFNVSISGIHHRHHGHGQSSSAAAPNGSPTSLAPVGASDLTGSASSFAPSPSTGSSSASSGAAIVQAAAASAAPPASTISANVVDKRA
jgi:hypothetical protein